MTDRNAVLSVDLEFFSHIPAYRNARGGTPRSAIGLAGVEELLDAFENHDATSTFFVVSDIAASHPDAVRQIADAGHEIASHTHEHHHLTELDPETRKTELVTSRQVLEETTGRSVTGFRAPSFDFTDDLFHLLDDAGYRYDSSVVPSRSIPGWYGGQYTTQRPCSAASIVADAPADIRELPVSVMPGLELPLTGTWLRFFGVRYTLLGMRLLARRDITPVLYVHPWELIDLPEVSGVPSRVYWRTGDWMRRAVERILSASFDFVTAGAALKDD